MTKEEVDMIYRGYHMKVVRRGYPDTCEYFSGGGFVQVTHTDERGLSFCTAHAKDDFDTDEVACYERHFAKCERHATNL